jgi:hypothetical protein
MRMDAPLLLVLASTLTLYLTKSANLNSSQTCEVIQNLKNSDDGAQHSESQDFYTLPILRNSNYSRLSIIRAWFNRFAAQPRQCIFKEKILFSVSITFI